MKKAAAVRGCELLVVFLLIGIGSCIVSAHRRRIF